MADGFNDPVGVASAFDGTGRLFVVERVGRIRVVTANGEVLPEPFLDLTKTNPLGTEVQTVFVEQGLWSVAFHPKFKDNGYVFVSFASVPFNGANLIVRFTVDPASPNQVSSEQFNKTVKVIMNIPQPYYNHYGGKIAFGPDGYLYIAKGDAGWEGDPLDAGQNLNRLWGKMLRINVDTKVDHAAYSIPRDNPFLDAGKDRMMNLFGITEEGFSKIKIGSRPEIWAYGLRNPWQFSFDPKTRRPVDRRRRPEPLGRDRLAAALQQGRRELRLEAQPGLEMPSDSRPRTTVPDRGRAAGGGVSAPGTLSGRAQAEGRLGLLGDRPGRGQLRRA